ncbi:NAD(P)H-binding protein [Rathayibacter sp. VKM Ac-2762]|uniref:SDR family oxidoreductase n=1 Tax=Rathayibacter sp. VKM Ac-2762 TaxID=2609254 RepID=UPI00132E7C52|nr:SDR family oxidoreductase [Rathayibacter sp. VKM Ac-2762]QHF21293.1 NAD(P)H-binding protein [Rathayibacter sp. VKM Ac-2762]
MRIVIVGGSGLIGRRLVELLRGAGHDVLAASPSTGVDTVTGAGVREAFAGADVVVDIPNSPSFADGPVMEFFRTSTLTIAEEAERAGIGHHVVLSIVGADRMPDIGYMRAKVAQEDIVKESGTPYTIVRATQFFEFIAGIAEGTADDTVVRLSPVLMQPIAASDVSEVLAEVATRAPADATWELAGPEALPIVELGRRVLAKAGDTREIVEDPAVGYYGGNVDDRSLTPGHDPALAHRLAETTLEEWLVR